MARFEIWQDLDMDTLPKVRQVSGTGFSADAGAALLGVRCARDGAPAQLSGTVNGYVIRPDGTMVNDISGTLSGNEASIVLPAAAYAVPGRVRVTLKLISGNDKTTLGAWDLTVVRSA